MSNVQMSPIKSLKGDLIGNGHVVSNLAISGSGNVGLIGELKGGSVENLTLTGVTVSGGSNTAVLVGLVSSSATITGCMVKNSTVSSTGYAGGLVGKTDGSSSDEIAITCCGVENTEINNTGTSTSYIGSGSLVGYSYYGKLNAAMCYGKEVTVKGYAYVGGAFGKVAASGAVNAENVYITGNVESTYSSAYIYTGGFAGSVSSTSSAKTAFSNCYFAGSITNAAASSNYTDAFVYASSHNYITYDNCFYNSDLTDLATKSSAAGKTTSEMQSADFAAALGSAYELNGGGYPTLKWQNPNATFSITLKVIPADAQVTFDGAAQPLNDTGIYTFTGFSSGTSHTYEVKQAESADTDLGPQRGSIVVGKSDTVKEIVLEANRYDLTFQVTPADAEFAVKDEKGEVLKAKSAGSGSYIYEVVNGAYTYTAEKFGYEPVEKTVTVDHGDKEESVGLTELSKGQVSFSFTFEGEKVSADEFDFDITCGDYSAEVEDGKVILYRGYQYDYVIRSKEYKKIAGTINADSGTVSVTLDRKTAWEGQGDLSEPEADENGVYQISNGGELAWFAALVNGTLEGTGQNKTAKAVLTKDIDLGGEIWTPIGTSSANRFGGTFEGQGYAIENLATREGSDYQGLFGYIDTGGKVSNLTITGTVKGRNYVGAAAGYNYGTIENVVNEAAISATGQSTGGIAGYLNKGTILSCINNGAVTNPYSSTSASCGTGGICGYAASSAVISNSANHGDVNGVNMYSVGGIAGYISSSTLENVYNTGNVTGKRAGGLIGYSTSLTVKKAYNAGIVTTTGTYAGELIGYVYSSLTAEDVYYNASNEKGNKAAGYGTITAEDGIRGIIGKGEFVSDTQNQNGGYPILSFEDKTPKFEVEFTVNPITAELSICSDEGLQMVPSSVENGVHRYDLPEGNYTYTVKQFGYTKETGAFAVTGQKVTRSVSLQMAPLYTVNFDIRPQEISAAVTLKYDGQMIEPEEDGSYKLPPGEYAYTVKAKGYAKAEGTLDRYQQS